MIWRKLIKKSKKIEKQKILSENILNIMTILNRQRIELQIGKSRFHACFFYKINVKPTVCNIYLVNKGGCMKQLFEGTAVALVTPFKNDEIDFSATKTLIERDIMLGARTIVILATTGEGCAVTDREREKFIKFCLKVNAGRAKIIVGTGNNNFAKCYSLTKEAKKLGADGALVVTPYYNKTTQKGLVEYYQKLAEIQFPIIMYNVPSRTGLNIELDTIAKIIATNEYVYGIKESTTDISRIRKLCHLCKDKIAVYSGEDELNHIFYCLGGKGCISVTANAHPDKVEEIYSLVKRGEYDRALACQQELNEVNEALFCETNPIPIKYYLSLMGLCESQTRMPLTSLTAQNERRIKAIYKFFNNEKEQERQ